MSVSLFVFPASREQEGTESDEGQLPQVLEELKDLQVAPGTRLAKFQLKVKGEELVRIDTVPQNRGHILPATVGRESQPAVFGRSCMCPVPLVSEGLLLSLGDGLGMTTCLCLPQAIQLPNCTGSKMASP